MNLRDSRRLGLLALCLVLVLVAAGCGDDASNTVPVQDVLDGEVLDAATTDIRDTADSSGDAPLDQVSTPDADAGQPDTDEVDQSCTPCEGDCPCPTCGDGQVDEGEECEAPFGACCDASTCLFMAADAACDDADGDACTLGACDGAGVCAPGTAPDGRGCGSGAACVAGTCTPLGQATVWTPFELAFTAAETHRWDAFPLRVTFSGPNGESLAIDAYWHGDEQWRVRFAAPSAGTWTWAAESSTSDDGLAGAGSFDVQDASAAQRAANPNLHGHVRANGQAFEYADGTPVFLLGDTFWYFNATQTYRALDLANPPSRIDIDRPLAALGGGFQSWLDDRSAKGFNAVMVRWVSGHARAGDTANEAGFLWDDAVHPTEPIVDWAEMNPAYFEPLDTRVSAIFEKGMVILGHPTELVTEPAMTVQEAVHLSRYLYARYGAYNVVWSLTGAFHEACQSYGDPEFCDNAYEGVRELGRQLGGSLDVTPTLEGFNPYGHPISVHPAGVDPGLPDVGHQTSRVFDTEGWNDHHWIHSDAETDKIVYRVSELRGIVGGGLPSEMPVVLAEPCYEAASCRVTDRDLGAGAELDAAIARRQAWTATVAGVAAYVYGANGVWDGTDEAALGLTGSEQMRHVRELVESLGWPNLGPEPCVERQVGGLWGTPGLEYPAATAQQVLDYTYAPRCMARARDAYLIYIPAGNGQATLRAVGLAGQTHTARWVDPRTGASTAIDGGAPINTDLNDSHPIPSRPSPADDDWVLVLE